jgi:hypothetical protein
VVFLSPSRQIQDIPLIGHHHFHTVYDALCITILSFDNIHGVSRLEDITAAGDFLGLSCKKSSYKHVSDFGRLRSYDSNLE